MSSRVRRTPRTDEDLVGHYRFIAEDSPEDADRFLQAAEATFEQLARMPALGRPLLLQSPRLAGVRRWRVRDFPNFLVYYRPLPRRAGVEILHVRHAARDVPDDGELGS